MSACSQSIKTNETKIKTNLRKFRAWQHYSTAYGSQMPEQWKHCICNAFKWKHVVFTLSFSVVVLLLLILFLFFLCSCQYFRYLSTELFECVVCFLHDNNKAAIDLWLIKMISWACLSTNYSIKARQAAINL